MHSADHPRKQQAILRERELLDMVTRLTPATLRNLHAIQSGTGELYVLEFNRTFPSLDTLKQNINILLGDRNGHLPVAPAEAWKLLLEPDMDYIHRIGLPCAAMPGNFIGMTVHMRRERGS